MSGVKLARSFMVSVMRKMLGWTNKIFLPRRAV